MLDDFTDFLNRVQNTRRRFQVNKDHVGDGAVLYADLFRGSLPGVEIPDDEACHVLRAELLLPVALARLKNGEIGDLEAMAPVYLRAPDIRKPKPKPKASGRGGRTEASSLGAPRAPAGAGASSGSLLHRAPASEADLVDLQRSLDRESGLRLDREVRWWHEGHVVEHEGVARAFHRWLDRLDDEGRYVLRLDDDRYDDDRIGGSSVQQGTA